MMEQYEKDKEIERLNKNVSRLEELLSVSETQYASVEQIVAHLQEQLKEANKVIKYFAYSKTGVEQEDGRFIVGLAGFDGTKAQAIYYDPRPAQNYCKKWGVK